MKKKRLLIIGAIILFVIGFIVVDEIKHNRETQRLENTISNLRSFKYEVRGDKKAYRLVYTDLKGNEQIVEGNYSEEYH